MLTVVELIRIIPQPFLICEGMWVYGDDVYVDDQSMAEHLFHNVYGNDLANGIDDDEEAYARVIDYEWYWQKV